MNDDSREKLNIAAVEVFGSMYFTPIELLADVPPENKWQLQKKYIRAMIAYNGPFNAEMALYFPEQLGSNIASGFLGVDVDKLTTDQIVDTMRESANMIVGSFLGKLDTEGKCKLGIPSAEMVEGFSPADKALTGSTPMVFMSDFGFMWIFHQTK